MAFFAVLLVFSLVSSRLSTIKDSIIIDIGKSARFSQEEITKAIDCVIYNFSNSSSTLRKIWFNEKSSNSQTTSYIEHGRGSNNRVSPENVIVLFSDFYVSLLSTNPVLTPNMTYTSFMWVLIRDSKTSNWIIDDSGY